MTAISSVSFRQDAVSQMDALQDALTKTQQQLSSGLAFQTAADNPVGMTQVNQLNMQLSATSQYKTNQNAVSSNLTLEESALTSATNVLESANTLAVQANDASLTYAQRQDIATQLQQLLQQLVGVANSTDSNGNYLFGGTATQTQPFTQSGNTVTYNGATQVNQVHISSNQSVSAGDSGASVFMNTPAGNGAFTTAAGSTNTGTGWIDAGTVTNGSQWSANTGTYTISFTDASDYQVTDGAGNVVSSGTYTTPGTIAFDGIQTTITGAPAAGDTFTIAPAGTASVFNTLSNLISALQSPTLNSGQLTSALATAQAQLNGAMGSIDSVQASVGARINAITAAQTAAGSASVAIQTNISNIQNVDYSQATTQLASEELALQAAQQSYVSISKLSLFNYLQS